jgi:hypothetical protein
MPPARGLIAFLGTFFNLRMLVYERADRVREIKNEGRKRGEMRGTI